MYCVHKYEVQQEYGGPEEGGWYYESGVPVRHVWQFIPVPTLKLAYALCRYLNGKEADRRNTLSYSYTSVLSNRETFYAYSEGERWQLRGKAYPESRPYYE